MDGNEDTERDNEGIFGFAVGSAEVVLMDTVVDEETGMRRYAETHPWLTFTLDLKKANYRMWLLLGEATSKSDHVRRALLRPETAREMLQVFLVKGALATTAIEGNTLTEEEARKVADNEIELPPSKEYLGQEIRNVLNAFNGIRNDILPDAEDTDLTLSKIKRFNREVLDGLEVEDGVIPGEIRTYSVGVGNYRGAPAEDCEYLLERMCEWLNSDAFRAPKDQLELAPPLAIIKAIMAHLYLAWIHPFGDGNGRTARLLEHHILLAEGFPQPVTQLLSNHYNRTRTDYYRQMSKSSRQGPYDFLLYAARGFVDELRAQLQKVWSMQYVDRWEQYVHQRFGEIKTDTQRRQLRLVKDLSKNSIRPVDDHPIPHLEAIPRQDLRYLSPQLAEAYAGKTDRTLSRDINVLLDMDLIVRTPDGYWPNSDAVLAFMPAQARSRVGDDLAPW